MTAPHLASDDLAINAAQARIRDNLEARARACFDAALKRPSLGAVDAVRRALMALHHQWVAGLEREPRPVVTGLAVNPAPVMPERGERSPIPCVPRYP